MNSARIGAALGQVHRLFGEGTTAGLTDAQLLERFVSVGDGASFEALVTRHGRMVQAVCRDVLKDPHDAEDAFQATFLVLVKKAGSLWLRGSLSSWLYCVAYRVAIQANKAASRRRASERQRGAEMHPPGSERLGPWHDLLPALHEEIDRLPEKYRAPVVLCEIEGLTRDQAAEQLGIPPGTVGSRLARGRDRLRDRLARRGVAPSAGLVASAFARQADAGVPDAWVRVAVDAATGSSAGAGALSTATKLSEEVLKMMGRTKLSIAIGTLAGVGTLAWTAGAAFVDGPKPTPEVDPPKASAPRAKAAAPLDDSVGTLEIRGRVLDPDGKPTAGAEVFLRNHIRIGEGTTNTIPQYHSDRIATTDADGRFRFALDKAASDWPYGDDPAWLQAGIAASAPGFGPAWIAAGEIAKGGEAVLRLVRDDVPIRGRILDTQARPVAGVAFRIAQIVAIKEDVDRDAMLASGEFNYQDSVSAYPGPTWLERINRLSTDAEGRFEVRGVGRDRLVGLEFASPSLEKVVLYAMTRLSKAPSKPRTRPSGASAGGLRVGPPPAPQLFGATFDQVAGPTKPISGVVRAKASGKPVAGVNVYGVEPSSATEVGATSDAEGRFLLTGLPKAESYEVRATPPQGIPLLQTRVRVTDTAGLSPVEIRLDLPKGVIVKGRLVDKSDGHSVPSPQVSHTKLPINLNEGDSDAVPTSGTDPRFVMTVPPGPGIFYARVKGPNIPYLRARLAPADRGKGVGGIEDNEPRRILLEANHTYRFIDVPADADVFNLDLELTRGGTRVGKVTGPDGEPVTGVQTYGLSAGWEVRILDGDTFEVLGLDKVRTLKGDTFKVPGLDAVNERLVAFSHKGRRLAGSLVVKDGVDPSPLQVRLVPCGTATGRVVDEDGRPLAGVRLRPSPLVQGGRRVPGNSGFWPEGEVVTTGQDGRFRIEGINPELGIGVDVEGQSRPSLMLKVDDTFRKITTKPGETVDLGDVHFRYVPKG